ncbi:MFS transporter [Sphingomonas astaxanthinifaciens DSM 22298]|uniref:MFS transporter n=1 Tax=Sphingomonas astaxanthinifaciens DSM 22298 TaxID=1123267 RepID=A0ABQ5Z3A0_9SPHN|nr:MFS transporter [Sphingomonas astaxanthinifaciens DSM 22298]
MLGFVSLFMDLSSEIIHALLPLFITVTLGASVAVLGAIDGVSEATASFAKLAGGRLSDRQQKRKPWILAGYGLAAVTKPLMALATGPWTVLGARLVDRTAKGLRGAPRDALIADDTPADQRGAAYGLRQSLDTIGALLAPIAAAVLMVVLAGDIRSIFWIAVVPAFVSVAIIILYLREPERRSGEAKPQPLLSGFREVDKDCRRIILVAFLFTLARFSESFLVLKGAEAGLSLATAPLVLAVFNLSYVLLSYPAGALGDRRDPRLILSAGIALLIVGNLVLANSTGLVGLVIGVSLWGAHMALTQGLFGKLVADAAPAHLRATTFGLFHVATGFGLLLASLGGGMLWDRDGPAATFLASAAIAAAAGVMLWLLPKPAPIS